MCSWAYLGPCPMVFGENKKSCWENRPQWDVDGLGALQEVPELRFSKGGQKRCPRFSVITEIQQRAT